MDLKQEIEQKRDRIGCMAVGCSNNTKLHFHHVQRHLKRKSPLQFKWSVRAAVDELRKCVVLCCDCHKQKAHNSKVVLLLHKHMEFCHLFLSTSFYVNTDPESRKNWMFQWKRDRRDRREERRLYHKAGIKTKWCRHCNKHLDITYEFHKTCRNKDGLHNICKCCRHYKRKLKKVLPAQIE